jgi:hypothetical protein
MAMIDMNLLELALAFVIVATLAAATTSGSHTVREFTRYFAHSGLGGSPDFSSETF